jgi:hypothetical protein
VPDVATVVADYNEGCQFLVSATMMNDVQLGEVIRGHLGTVKFSASGKYDYVKGFEVFGQNVMGGPKKPSDAKSDAIYTYENPKFPKGDGVEEWATYALWENFIECVGAKRRETLSTPELGAAAFSTVNMGVQGYRQGKVLFWDKDKRQVKDADPSWATTWEKRSKDRGKPNQIIGWTGGDKGSTLTPKEYQKLEGPWADDTTDPADKK